MATEYLVVRPEIFVVKPNMLRRPYFARVKFPSFFHWCDALLRIVFDPHYGRSALVPARAACRADRSSLAGVFLAILTAALIAGGITVLTAIDRVEAGSQETMANDRRPIGPQCSQQPWPYYEARCVRDLRPLEAQGRVPRVIAIGP